MGSTIPVYVVAFNQLTYVKDSVDQLRKFTNNIVIVDNCSTYLPLLNYYEKLQNDSVVRIVRHDRNYGHLVVTEKMHSELPEVFAITDPDLKFNDDMPADALNIMKDIGVEYNAYKVGVALDISPSLNFIDAKLGKHTIRQWENQFWQKPIPHPTLSLFDAVIDTTLAVYNQKLVKNKKRGIRVAGVFTSIHRPWLIENGMSDDEQKYYVEHKTTGIWLR